LKSFFTNPDPGKITFILSFAMVVIFLFLGYVLIGTNFLADRLPPRPNRTYVGILLLVWAVFRAITVWMRYQKWKQENEE
jgi:hypothetical protein